MMLRKSRFLAEAQRSEGSTVLINHEGHKDHEENLPLFRAKTQRKERIPHLGLKI